MLFRSGAGFPNTHTISHVLPFSSRSRRCDDITEQLALYRIATLFTGPTRAFLQSPGPEKVILCFEGLRKTHRGVGPAFQLQRPLSGDHVGTLHPCNARMRVSAGEGLGIKGTWSGRVLARVRIDALIF